MGSFVSLSPINSLWTKRSRPPLAMEPSDQDYYAEAKLHPAPFPGRAGLSQRARSQRFRILKTVAHSIVETDWHRLYHASALRFGLVNGVRAMANLGPDKSCSWCFSRLKQPGHRHIMQKSLHAFWTETFMINDRVQRSWRRGGLTP